MDAMDRCLNAPILPGGNVMFVGIFRRMLMRSMMIKPGHWIREDVDWWFRFLFRWWRIDPEYESHITLKLGAFGE